MIEIDMGYQSGGPKAFPEWVPNLLPIHIESLTEQITEAFRGPGKGTTNPSDLFSDEERELRYALALADEFYYQETPY